MQTHQVRATIKRKSKKIIGRGGKRGTYSGRGQKGQKSRAGHRIRPEIRDVIKRIPKKRGYRFASIQEKPVVVNLEVLEKKFKEGDKITPETLVKAGIVSRKSGKIPEVKLLGTGEITKKLLVSECQISDSAREKIEKAGGKVEIKSRPQGLSLKKSQGRSLDN